MTKPSHPDPVAIRACFCLHCGHDIRVQLLEDPKSVFTCPECGGTNTGLELIRHWKHQDCRISKWWFALIHGLYLGPLLLIVMFRHNPGVTLILLGLSGVMYILTMPLFFLLGYVAFGHDPSPSDRWLTAFLVWLLNCVIPSPRNLNWSITHHGCMA